MLGLPFGGSGHGGPDDDWENEKKRMLE